MGGGGGGGEVRLQNSGVFLINDCACNNAHCEDSKHSYARMQ